MESKVGPHGATHRNVFAGHRPSTSMRSFASGWRSSPTPSVRRTDGPAIGATCPSCRWSSLTEVLDRPLTARIFFEEVIRENLDLGRPDQVQLIFGRR